MPSAIPTNATARLPKARMIDPRGHRFGAGVSAVLLIVAFLTSQPWLVAVVLVSIGVSAAFGLRYSRLRDDLAADRRCRASRTGRTGA